jgi:hypothetical protein
MTRQHQLLLLLLLSEAPSLVPSAVAKYVLTKYMEQAAALAR